LRSILTQEVKAPFERCSNCSNERAVVRVVQRFQGLGLAFHVIVPAAPWDGQTALGSKTEPFAVLGILANHLYAGTTCSGDIKLASRLPDGEIRTVTPDAVRANGAVVIP